MFAIIAISCTKFSLILKFMVNGPSKCYEKQNECSIFWGVGGMDFAMFNRAEHLNSF